MDAISSAATSFARTSTAAWEVAAGELAKQASSLAAARDPIAWITGDDADDADQSPHEDDCLPPPVLVPVPLAALRPWGCGVSGSQAGFGFYGGDSFGGYGGSSSSGGAAYYGKAYGGIHDSCGYGGSSGSGYGVRREDAYLSNAYGRSDTYGIFASDETAVDTDGAVDVDTSGYHAPATASTMHAPAPPRKPPWSDDPDLNGKIILWEGDLCALEADALVAPAAAGYACGASTVLARILRCGGKDLRGEVKFLDPCRSGEARLCKSYGMPCQRLIMTVGPKYKDKYQIAAQNTLNACYRESLQLLAEAELRTVAMPCVWYHKGYPAEEQAHVALRTLRRCLEKLRRQVDTVVLVAGTRGEFELYDGIMSWYFPRNAEEAEAAARVLPECCWNEWGEVSVEERRIRVSSLVSASLGQADGEDGDKAEPLFTADDKAFLHAREDADTQALRRLSGTMSEAEDTDTFRQAFGRYLRRARDLPAEPPDRRFVFRVDKALYPSKPQIVVLLGARLPALGVRDERTMALFVKEMELLRGEKFALLYVNTGVDVTEGSKLEVLQELLTVIHARYRDTLDMMLVLHPGIWFRAAFVVGRAVSETAARAWHDTVYLEGLHDLTGYGLDPRVMGLPEYIAAYELSG